jgi:hypothetical protein
MTYNPSTATFNDVWQAVHWPPYKFDIIYVLGRVKATSPTGETLDIVIKIRKYGYLTIILDSLYSS